MTRRLIRFVKSLLLLSLLSGWGFAQVTACSTLYGGGISSTNNPAAGPVFTINPATGARVASIFTPGYATAAIARHPTNNRIYFIENTVGTTAARLGYYDLSTNTLNSAAATINKGSDSGNFTRFGFNASGVGYASISANNAVYTITPSGNTATIARLGTITGLPENLSGDFAITTANRAWLSANGEIYRIDLNQASLPAVTVYTSSNATVNGVAFDSNANLLTGDASQLYRTDLGTLAQTTTASTYNAANSLSADLTNCVNPTLVPNLSVVKTVSPTGAVAPGTVLSYTITVSNSGNAVAVNTTFQDSIPTNTSYVANSTTLNGAAVTDAVGGVMPFATAAPIKSSAASFGSGIVGTTATNQVTITFQVRVNNPFPSASSSVANQGYTEYDSGTGDARTSVPSAPTAGGSGPTTTLITGRDFGDAPDTATGTASGNYQTTGADNGPSHTIVAGLRLGSVAADADNGTLQNTAASADDASATDDEDGVSSFPVFTTASGQTITIPLTVTNTTSAAASLVGYLDFNKDGDFLDTGEQSSIVSVAVGQTSASVVFTTPSGLTAGTTYARFRIGSVSGEVTGSVGAASSGEVEDYLVIIGSPDLTIAKTHTPASFVRGSSGSYTFTAGNSGNQPTSGTVTVTDTLPSGVSVNSGSARTVTPGGANAANWTCASSAASPQVITCTSTAVIGAGGSSVFTLSVEVASNAGTPVVNNAVVSGGGEAAANNGNNTASDSAVTVAPTDLTLAKAHTGNFTVGQLGTYTFTVNNAGGVSSSGAVTVTDTLPAGLTFVTGSTTGTSWSCSASGQTVTCTSNTAIAAAGSTTFSFSVNVGTGTAPGINSVTNTAAVSGGGDSNTANNSANNGSGDPTTVLSPDLTVSKAHTPSSFVQGSTGNYRITVLNNTVNATAPASGTITVTDTLPAGLSVPAGAGPLTVGGGAWSCSVSGQVITCTQTGTIASGSSSTFNFDVNVAPNAPASVTNRVSVAGVNEATAYGGNNGATDTAPTADAGRLTLTKSVRNVTVNSSFSTSGSGRPGDVLEYCVSYSNPGQSEVTNTGISDTVPTTTTPLTSVGEYGGQAIRWRTTRPNSSSQNLSAAADADAGELAAALTVRVGAVSAGGAGDVCFQVRIR